MNDDPIFAERDRLDAEYHERTKDLDMIRYTRLGLSEELVRRAQYIAQAKGISADELIKIGLNVIVAAAEAEERGIYNPTLRWLVREGE